MTSTPPVRLVDAGKQYTKYEDAPMIVTAALRLRSRTRRSRLWALRHLSCEVEDGECVGIIGRNGAGKSTALQLLAGVTAPTEGSVSIRGRVAPLISVGVGFHPELTGRENVYVNGTILGLPHKEIDRRFDEIVAFSEIESFIDTPVKFYSSGMFVRLGFAVAIHIEPDVLLVDEVLAVGDFAFQLKCFDRMMEQQRAGATILVVSHNLAAVRRLCDRTIVLDRGEPRFQGDTVEAISLYHKLAGERRDIEHEDVVHGMGATIESFNLWGPDGSLTGHVHGGDDITFRLEVRFDRDVERPVFGFRILDEKGVVVYSESSVRHLDGSYRAGDVVAYEVRMPVTLTTGSFIARAGVVAGDMKTQLDNADPLPFYVTGREMVRGVADLGAQFSVVPIQRSDRGPGREVPVQELAESRVLGLEPRDQLPP